MAGQGHSMPQESVQRIVHLLSSTEMSVAEIAERMACSRSVVIAINRRFQVREYSGLRTRWLKVNGVEVKGRLEENAARKAAS